MWAPGAASDGDPFQETVGVMSSRPVLLEECTWCSRICKGSISRADVGAESSGAQKWSERCPQEQNNYRGISRERFYRFPYTLSLVEEFKAFQVSPATAPIAPHHGLAPVVSTGCLLQCLLCPSFCKEINRILIILCTLNPTCAQQLGRSNRQIRPHRS